MKQHISLSGQFRIVKKSSDNQVLFDSGELNNLLLDTGLDYFGDNTGESNILRYLAVGTGNSTPTITQNSLDNAVAVAYGAEHSRKDDYDAVRDGDYHTASRTYKYRLTNLRNVNIAELGLVSGTDLKKYIAYTRALIKDDRGRPLVITVLDGEILEVYYTIKQVYHLVDKEVRLPLLDGRGGQRGFVRCLMRLCSVGTSSNTSASYGAMVGQKLNWYSGHNFSVFNSQVLGAIAGIPQGRRSSSSSYTIAKGNYIAQSCKNTLTLTIADTFDSPELGAMMFVSTMGMYQISFTNDDGSMIDKNRTRTFSITLEFSWGRDERK